MESRCTKGSFQTGFRGEIVLFVLHPSPKSPNHPRYYKLALAAQKSLSGVATPVNAVHSTTGGAIVEQCPNTLVETSKAASVHAPRQANINEKGS